MLDHGIIGAWVRESIGGEAAGIPWLSKESGLIALQLSTSTSGVEGLHDVEVSNASPI